MRHMAFKRIICIGVLLMSVGLFSACGCNQKIGGPSKLPPFKSELTAEEHIANITQRTEGKNKDANQLIFLAEQMSLFDVGSLWSFKSFTVETLWSFKEKPEYFLVEFEELYYLSYKNVATGYYDKFGYEKCSPVFELQYVESAYLIGYIAHEVYYQYDGYPYGRKSPFKERNYEKEKKYYGYIVMAVKEGKNFVNVLNGLNLSKSERRNLAKHDYRMGSSEY